MVGKCPSKGPGHLGVMCAEPLQQRLFVEFYLNCSSQPGSTWGVEQHTACASIFLPLILDTVILSHACYDVRDPGYAVLYQSWTDVIPHRPLRLDK